MIFRPAKRQNRDQPLAKYLSNRERVRSWITGWDCPEIDWPGLEEIPHPWGLPRGSEEKWLRRHGPFPGEYRWLLEARPLTPDISQVWAVWQFDGDHQFDRLEIEVRCVPDPVYLAEKLTLAAHAADLKGWQEQDQHALYDWLIEGLDSRPLSEGVRGQKRAGFILFALTRMPIGSATLSANLRMTLTDTALDGSPLNAQGEPL
ncbi:unnamed protein product [[Actinomadura] parvosata subsp. kistnae]|uniref:Uncharacterized protein n=1 Tax=[Actinomadura] parvosata subsp. kistnae TaxID=1909395 RepID=A0A1U9ZZJ9_9ACTN|nr:hypothetical protein [Nonomuraea sp. ATCC 55076]AQZ63386.1 hypothetical protein BKM31_19680 [Nonomuraea sp. ATCC 55076]SPL99104.1 unnamed protein product [Actinomadura parvosata subsp. kistnae]